MLNKATFLLVCGVSVAVVLLATVQAHEHKMPKIKCLDVEVDMTDCFKGFMECAKEMMPAEDVKAFFDPKTTEEKKKELGKKAHDNHCIRVCQWKKHIHLLNEDGSLNKTENDKYIDAHYPEAARPGLKAGMEKCHKDNSNAFKEDNNCAGYTAFEECIKKSYMEVCKVDKAQFDAME